MKTCTGVCKESKPKTSEFFLPKPYKLADGSDAGYFYSRCRLCLSKQGCRDRVYNRGLLNIRWARNLLTIAKHHAIKGNFAPPNITAEELVVKRADYAGLCGSCSEPCLKPCLDHCHVTGDVGEFICFACNIIAGYLESYKANLIVKYLKRVRR
jgi:hypothetical protein